MFQDEDDNQDMDTMEGDGATGGKGKETEHDSREAPKEPTAQSGKDDDASKGGKASTPMNTLRFGSFGASSAPGHLWRCRDESKEPSELMLPMLPTLGALEQQPLGADAALVSPVITGTATPVARSAISSLHQPLRMGEMGGTRQEASFRPVRPVSPGGHSVELASAKGDTSPSRRPSTPSGLPRTDAPMLASVGSPGRGTVGDLGATDTVEVNPAGR